MKPGRSTIRRKLMALVLLPTVATLGTLAALERILEGQLLQGAEQRVAAAQGALQGRLDDDLKALKLELLGVADSAHLSQGLRRSDAPAVVETTESFANSYPELALLVADAQGRVLAAEGIEGISELRQLPSLDVLAEPGAITKTLSKQGCAGHHETPARLLATRVGEVGVVVACQRLDAAFLKHASDQLGMGLALVDEDAGHRVLSHTPGFPLGAPPARGESALHEEHGELWAVAHFCPALFPETDDDCTLDALTALPVGHIQSTLRKDFALVLFLLATTSGLALVWGGRMALRMTRALERLVQGFRSLARQEYARVEPPSTGDELEELAQGFNHAVAGLEERDRLKTTFGKYMTESVMSHLLSHQVHLGGDTLPVTILFSDIRGFTSISEQLDAQHLVSLLNEYFTEMVDIVMDHGGVVDKYIGDAIMVVFGAPVPQPDDALRAVRAAVRMRQSLARLNRRLTARGASPIRTGIGLHSGDVVAGNIGSERRMEYTVIGDAVNLASRLEGSTKELGADLVISEATYTLVRDHVAAEPLGTISVKGREQPVQVYAVSALVAGDSANVQATEELEPTS